MNGTDILRTFLAGRNDEPDLGKDMLMKRSNGHAAKSAVRRRDLVQNLCAGAIVGDHLRESP